MLSVGARVFVLPRWRRANQRTSAQTRTHSVGTTIQVRIQLARKHRTQFRTPGACRAGRAPPPSQPPRAITPDAQHLPAIAPRSDLVTRTKHIDVKTGLWCWDQVSARIVSVTNAASMHTRVHYHPIGSTRAPIWPQAGRDR